MRSALWDPRAQVDRSVFPSIGEMIRDQINWTGKTETQEEMLLRYKETLY